MHRSRLYGVFVDTPVADAPGAAAFWSGVFGVPARATPGAEQFTALPGAVRGLLCVVPVHSAPDVFAADARTWGS